MGAGASASSRPQRGSPGVSAMTEVDGARRKKRKDHDRVTISFRPCQPLDAGCLQPEISSFRLHLAAQGKAARTVGTYTEAVQWFAAACLLPAVGPTAWEEVGRRDVQQWIASLLDTYSAAYASNQFRALQQFFKWLSDEEEIPDPMAGLRPPHVAERPVPVFTGEELTLLERACAGRSFQQRRDAAMIAALKATGIRLSELAGIRYDPGDPRRSDLDLWHREITVHGKGPQDPGRQGQPQCRPRPRPLPPSPRPARPGIPAAVVARGEQPGTDDRQRDLPGHRPPWPPVRHRGVPAPVPAPLQPRLARPRRRRGRPDGAQRLVLPADAAPLRRQRPRRPSPTQLRPHRGRSALA
jgi:hypothetical protein